MALWPFGKKNKQEEPVQKTDKLIREDVDSAVEADPPHVGTEDVLAAAQESGSAPTGIQAVIPHDAVNGDTGPFDGDNVNIDDFDFSDFSSGVLDLGSLKIPLPKGSQVQVEMGDNGPKRVHIVTTAGRITPVAFAAPKVSGQWEEASADLLAGIQDQGMTADFEQGPWGREIVGVGPQNTMRMIGVDGPRWMLRFTCSAPTEKADELAVIARDVAARTFIYRGSDPILAGNSLPVVIPAQLVSQLQEEIKRRQQQQEQQLAQQQAVKKAQEAIAQQQKQNPQQGGAYNPEEAAEAMRRLKEAIAAQVKNSQANATPTTDSEETK